MTAPVQLPIPLNDRMSSIQTTSTSSAIASSSVVWNSSITPPLNDLISVKLEKEAFRPGQVISGHVILNLPEQLEISGIYLQLQGTERVRFRASVRSDFSGSASSDRITELKSNAHTQNTSFRKSKRPGSVSHQQTINTGIPTRLPITQPHFLQSSLVCITVPVTRYRGRLTAGQHSFAFSFALPSRLPPSLHFASGSKYLAEVVYELDVQVFRPSTSVESGKSSALLYTHPLKILSLPKKSTNQLPASLCTSVQAAHLLCCLPAKHLDFTADWQKSLFSPEEEVNIALNLDKVSSWPSGISVKLVQELVLNISGHFYRHVTPILKSKFPQNGALQTGFSIPAGLLPSTQTDAIECKYFLVFEVDWRWAEPVLLAGEIEITE